MEQAFRYFKLCVDLSTKDKPSPMLEGAWWLYWFITSAAQKPQEPTKEVREALEDMLRHVPGYVADAVRGDPKLAPLFEQVAA